jgi:hypothetical protein
VNVRSPHRRPRSRPATWLGALLVLASLVGRGAGAVHEISTTHVRCADHGELIDVGATPVDAATQVVTGASLTPSDQPSDGTAPEHDHCSLAVTFDQPAPTVKVARFLIVVAAPEERPLAPAIPAIVPAQRALLRAAPKTSPPTV